MLATRGRPADYKLAAETEHEDPLAVELQVPFDSFYREQEEIEEADETVKSLSPRTPVPSGRHGSSPRRTTHSSSAGEVSIRRGNVEISDSDEVECVSRADKLPFGQAPTAQQGGDEAETEHL